MKLKILTWLCMVFLIVPAASEVFADDYTIGPGDVLDISVWKNPDLTRQLVVLPDGKIHFPLIKELAVEGVTVKGLESMIIEKLKKYVPDPDLSISVNQVNSMMVYVIGKVNHPGRFPINTRIDVLQALAVAGGLNPFAKDKEIKIFRKADGQTTLYNFNYEEVSQGENLEQNIMLERGDVIVVR